jgi:hypothetical protein
VLTVFAFMHQKKGKLILFSFHFGFFFSHSRKIHVQKKRNGAFFCHHSVPLELIISEATDQLEKEKKTEFEKS